MLSQIVPMIHKAHAPAHPFETHNDSVHQQWAILLKTSAKATLSNMYQHLGPRTSRANGAENPSCVLVPDSDLCVPLFLMAAIC